MAPYGSNLFPTFGMGSIDILHSAAQPLALQTIQEETAIHEFAVCHSELWMQKLTDLITPHVLEAVRAHIDPDDYLQRSFVDPRLGHRQRPKFSLDSIEGNPNR